LPKRDGLFDQILPVFLFGNVLLHEDFFAATVPDFLQNVIGPRVSDHDLVPFVGQKDC